MNLVECKRRYPHLDLRAYMQRRMHVCHEGRVESPEVRAEQRLWGHRMARVLHGARREIAPLMNAIPQGCHCEKALAVLSQHNWFISRFSNRWMHDTDRREVVDGYVSHDEIRHYRACNECASVRLRAEMICTVDDNDYFCDGDCARDYGCEHGVGDRWYSSPEEDRWDDDDDEDNDGGLYSYCTYLGGLIGEGGKYNLGTEIEMEYRCARDQRAFISQIGSEFKPKQAHCKRDGSLDTWGVELVTGYGKLEDMAPVVGRACEIAVSCKGRSHTTDTCGQHIAVSRGNMAIDQQARFIVFFNHPDNQKMLVEFARRSDSSWARPDSRKATKEWLDGAKGRGRIEYGSKYEAVNCGHDTHLEVRIFRGSLRAPTVIARMAMVEMVAVYCEEDRPVEELTFSRFLEWLNNQSGTSAQYIKDYLVYRSVKQPALAV
jgi:hypothetical protein